MANDIKVNVVLEGLEKSGAATKEFSNQLNTLGKTTKAAQDSFTSITNIISQFKGLIVGALAGISFKEMIDEAVASENAMSDLTIALKQFGNYSEETVKSLSDFASAIQETTKYEDDQVIKTAAMIETLTGLKKDGLEQATLATLNFASAMKLDTVQAGEVVSKALEGNVGVLKRYGVQVKESHTSTERFNNTMKALEEKFGGRIQQEVTTFSGGMEQLKNNFTGVLEEVGFFITKSPIVITAFQEILKVIKLVSSSLAGFNTADFIVSAIENLKAFSGAIAYLVSPIELAYNGFKVFFQGVNVIVATLVNRFAEFGGFIADFAAKLGADNDFVKGLQTFRDSSSEVLDDVKNNVQKAGEEIFDFSATANVQNAFDGFISNVEKNKAAMDKAARDAGKGAKVAFESEWDKIQVKPININVDFAKIQEEASKNPIKSVWELVDPDGLKVGKHNIEQSIKTYFDLDKRTESMLTGTLNGVGAAITQGAEGARKLMVGFVSEMAAKIPVIGPIIAQFFDMFTRGPEFTKSMIKGFILGIPQIIKNLILALPAFYQALVEAAPEFVKAILEIFSPQFAEMFTRAMLNAVGQIPSMVAQIFTNIFSYLSNIGEYLSMAGQYFMEYIGNGAWAFISNIVTAIYDAVMNMFGGGGGGDGLLGIGVLGLARGGQIVKGGIAGKDSVPAALMPGELVVDDNTTKQLQSFLDGKPFDVMSSLLNQILQKIGGEQTINTSVELNNKTFANIILELNRNNARLA